ncbi:MAG: PAS domain-containing protein [Nitrospirae bacterium]|nr:PAS domain-containing protein [Nitrospirota bacterium]
MTSQAFFTLIAAFSLMLVLIAFFLIRAVMSLQKKKLQRTSEDSTQVGFVVDTFHDLVSQLKEKERELESLRKIAEERASSVELYNENILQSVPSGVVSVNDDLTVTKVNAAAEKILELKGSAVPGRKFHDVFSEPIAGMIAKRQTVDRAEVGYITKSGKRIWLGLNISPLKDSSGNTIGRIIVFTDLTELKAFQSQMELRERLSTLGEMSAGIAHELRNPMAVISGYTKILHRKVEPDSIPAVEAISKEVAVMDRIITDFLSFARPTEPIVTNVDLNELILGCINALPECFENVRIVHNLGALPVIRADEVLLRQAFTNIVQNAAEAMPDGGEISIRCSAGDSLDISVSDTGHGLPEGVKEKIFLPFFTTKERGTGLGLSIVHKIVVSHGGTVDVLSTDKGTTFIIRLPKDLVIS